MIENEMNDREQTQQTLRPAQAAPVRRADSVSLSQAAEAQNSCAGVEASQRMVTWPVFIPFAGDDAE